MATKDNKALKWLYDNDIKKDNLKSSVFFVALKNLYKSKADRKKLDKASEYGAIVLRAIDRKKHVKTNNTVYYYTPIQLHCKRIYLYENSRQEKKRILLAIKTVKKSLITPYLK